MGEKSMSTEEYIKKVIKENLLIEVIIDPDSISNGANVSLRFKGDDKPFSVGHVVIPDGS